MANRDAATLANTGILAEKLQSARFAFTSFSNAYEASVLTFR